MLIDLIMLNNKLELIVSNSREGEGGRKELDDGEEHNSVFSTSENKWKVRFPCPQALELI